MSNLRIPRGLLTAALLGVALAHQAPGALAQEVVRVEAARLITAPGSVLEGDLARLLIQDGKITAVGNEVPAEGPAGARVVRFEDGTIAPGFVLPHSSLGAGQDFVETIDAFTPHLRAAEAFDPFADELHDLAKSGVTTIGLAPSSQNTFPGRAAIVHTGEEGSLGSDSWLKIALVRESLASDRFPTSRMGAVDLIRQAFGEAADPLLGDSEELQVLRDVLAGNLRVAMHARTQTELRLALDLSAELSVDPILLEATDLEPLMPRLQSMNVSIALPGLDYGSSEERLELPAKLAEAGIPFSFLAGDGPSLRRTMHLAIQNGLAPDTALDAATRIAASQLGIEDQIGSLRKGRRADFCVFDGAPQSLTSSIVSVFVGGESVALGDEEGNN
ncbi:MAG: amidohydrolase family protein [Planctomycetota bacterium]